MAPQGVEYPVEGGCSCGELRYSLTTAPMVVQCCHCRYCQRETGASFALHAMIETERLKLLKGEIEWTTAPSHSGAGQDFARCAECKIAVWSLYDPAEGDGVRLVDVGTLDNPDAFPPNAQIYIASKQPWITLSDKIPAFADQNYDREKVWSKDGLERRRKLQERAGAK